MEHEGYSGEPMTPAIAATQAQLLRWIAAQVDWERYVPLQNLIGHCHIGPVHRRFCSGPAFDYDAIAAAANARTQNLEPRTFTRRYRVKAGGATIRQAWWRSGPHAPSNIAGRLAPGTLVEVDSLQVGKTVEREDLWAHLSAERGFVIASVLE